MWEKAVVDREAQLCLVGQGRVVCPSLELEDALPTHSLTSHMITLPLSNGKMENALFSGLGLLGRPSWSFLPPEITSCLWSVLQLEALWKFIIFEAGWLGVMSKEDSFAVVFMTTDS